ncbi:MAG: helix-turn-helix domain-containing protein [Eubacteriales bacterium]|nr:helix-turn-helix domain-containing protein [Eubacteriales bacterium]
MEDDYVHQEGHCRERGSKTYFAEHLFIHKNTVQYEINKIKAKTGLDVREMEDLQTLILAAKWYASGTGKGKKREDQC